MRRPVVRAVMVALAAGMCLASAQSLAQSKKGGKKKSGDTEGLEKGGRAMPAAKFAGTIPGARASNPEKQSDWPAIAHTSDGALWIAYVEWNDKDADRVVVRRRAAGGEWGTPIEIADGNSDHYAPAVASLGTSIAVVWPAQVNGNFELFTADVSPEGRSTEPRRLTSAPHSDINVRAAGDGTGNLTIVWQSFRSGNADVYAMRRTGAKWGREVLISASPASDWEPAVALDSRGAAWISWDSYDHGNYDVLLRSLEGDKPGAIIPVTTEPAAQFHSSVAVDAQDRVWVAWDDGGMNWGKDFSTSSAAPGSQGLHYSRTLGVRVWSKGVLSEPAAPVDATFTGRMKQFAELPHLGVDAAGAVVMVFRHWTGTQPNEIYHFYLTRLSGDRWTEPYQFAQSSGHNSQRVSLARNAAGEFTAAYASDGRTSTVVPQSQAHAMHYVAYTSDIAKLAAAASAELRPVTLPAAGVRPPRRPRASMNLAGRTYRLMLGDCHRHTDIRGHSGVDGSILDTYRYAIDAAQLDFLGTSDHNEVVGGKWPDGLRDYQWWYTQKSVDLFTHSPVFTGMYSYEHSMNRPGGHRNVLFLKRGAPLRMINRDKGIDAEDNAPPAMWKFWEEKVLSQPGQRSVIVPHTFAAGPLADWNWPNARFDCLLEIYQGARGSYEYFRAPRGEIRGRTQVDEAGHYAQDALAKGNVYGFVSFSDHASTHNSWAAVWSLTEDRAGILDGMYERRTYAGTDEMILRVSADGHMPGQEWTAAVTKPVRIRGQIDAPDTILRVDVVKDGKFVYTMKPNARSAKLDWRDREVKAGKSYYYVRVFQRDTEKPDGDPEIAWASPFYVTYR